MANVKYNKYEEALKHVKRIKGFYKHIITYIIFNIILFIIKWRAVDYVLNNTAYAEKGLIDWMYVDIFSTPVIWGIILLIHGLYVYRYKFTFFKKWEYRKIKEYMDQEEKDVTKNKNWM